MSSKDQLTRALHRIELSNGVLGNLQVLDESRLVEAENGTIVVEAGSPGRIRKKQLLDDRRRRPHIAKTILRDFLLQLDAQQVFKRVLVLATGQAAGRGGAWNRLGDGLEGGLIPVEQFLLLFNGERLGLFGRHLPLLNLRTHLLPDIIGKEGRG